jgi:hypothetical protein
MTKLKTYQHMEPIEIHEARLIDLKLRVNTDTRSMLKSGITMLESQVREFGRRIEADEIATRSEVAPGVGTVVDELAAG